MGYRVPAGPVPQPRSGQQQNVGESRTAHFAAGAGYGGSDPGIHAQLTDPVQARSWAAQVGEVRREDPDRYSQMTRGGTGAWGSGSEAAPDNGPGFAASDAAQRRDKG